MSFAVNDNKSTFTRSEGTASSIKNEIKQAMIKINSFFKN